MCSLLRTDGTSAGLEVSADQLGERFCVDPVIPLGDAVGIAPARRGGDPGSNPDSSENFSFKFSLRI